MSNTKPPHPNDQSAQPCGCDPGAGWVCEWHQRRKPFCLCTGEHVCDFHRRGGYTTKEDDIIE